VTYGRASTNTLIPLNGDTLFEIGSISKVLHQNGLTTRAMRAN
jgi:hypothetical protein